MNATLNGPILFWTPHYAKGPEMAPITNPNNPMMNFIRENARLLATLVTAGINYLFAADFDPALGIDFFQYLFSEFAFTVGMAVVLLSGWIGERRLIAIEPNTTLTAITAIVTVLLPLLQAGVDWSSLVGLINIFASTGQLTFGAVLGVIANYFSDIRVGRPQLESAQLRSRLHKFDFSNLPEIIVYGRVR